jgi:cytochrome P450
MLVTDKIVESLQYGLTQILDDGPQTISNPANFLQQLVAFISVRVLIGPEVATNRNVIDTFAQLTSDITRNIVLWQVLPESWHQPLLPYLQSLNRHKVNMDLYVEPIVQKRRDMLRDGQLEPNSKLDYMQELIEFQYPDGSTFTNKEITDAILLIAFASVHTVSIIQGL